MDDKSAKIDMVTLKQLSLSSSWIRAKRANDFASRFATRRRTRN